MEAGLASLGSQPVGPHVRQAVAHWVFWSINLVASHNVFAICALCICASHYCTLAYFNDPFISKKKKKEEQWLSGKHRLITPPGLGISVSGFGVLMFCQCKLPFGCPVYLQQSKDKQNRQTASAYDTCACACLVCLCTSMDLHSIQGVPRLVSWVP